MQQIKDIRNIKEGDRVWCKNIGWVEFRGFFRCSEKTKNCNRLLKVFLDIETGEVAIRCVEWDGWKNGKRIIFLTKEDCDNWCDYTFEGSVWYDSKNYEFVYGCHIIKLELIEQPYDVVKNICEYYNKDNSVILKPKAFIKALEIEHKEIAKRIKGIWNGNL